MAAQPGAHVTTLLPAVPEHVRDKIAEMVRRIVQQFDPERIVLFGSHARGEAGPDSDVDLLVVAETQDKKDTTLKMRVAVRAMGIPKDIVVVTPEEFARRRDIVGSIVYPAAHEGIALYERSA